MPKVGLCEWQQLLKSKSSELTAVNKDEEESYLSSHCSRSNGASKAIHPKKSDTHHTGKPRKGSLQYHTREIIKGRRSGIRERKRACVSGISIGSILVLGKQLGGVEVAWI
jgi:hypothetical protein